MSLPSSQTVLGRADLIRSLARDGDTSLLDRLAERLGYEAKHIDEKSTPPILQHDPLPQSAPAPSDTHPKSERRQTAFWMPLHWQPGEKTETEDPKRVKKNVALPPSYPLDGTPDGDGPPPAQMSPLCPWPSLEPRLRPILAQIQASTRLDAPRITRQFARGRGLSAIPYQPSRRWGHNLIFLFDRHEHLVPFWDDQDIVFRKLLDRLGGSNIFRAVVREDTEAPEFLTSPGSAATPPDLMDSTVLVVGDLATLKPGAGRNPDPFWLKYGRDLHAAGARALVLSPAPLNRIPKALRDLWTIIPWERPTTNRRHSQQELKQRALSLLTLLAPATYITPGMIRETRKLLEETDTDAGTEVDVWTDTALTGNNFSGARLVPEAAETLRQQFEKLEKNDLTRHLPRNSIQTLRRWRSGLPRELWYAELLKLPAHQQKWVPAEDMTEARNFFRDFAAHVQNHASNNDVLQNHKLWFRSMTEGPEMHRLKKDPEVGRDLHKLGIQLLAHLPVKKRPDWFDDALLPAPNATITTQHWNIIEQKEGLELSPHIADQSHSQQARNLATIRTDRPRIHYLEWRREWFWKNAQPPLWATDWGNDRFGAWALLQISTQHGTAEQKLRWIPPGRFMMGSPDDEEGRRDDEGPQHEVTIEKGYWLFDTPVTQQFWQTLTGENPSRFQDKNRHTSLRPVETISWDDCQDFARKLNEACPGFEACLPSEAQWEYACRAGTTTARYGENVSDLGWFGENSEGETHPVKLKAPNAFGLYDMLGNVEEWCQDDWHENYAGAPTTGSAWKAEASASELRPVFRGGSWIGDPRHLRSAIRDWYPAGIRVGNLGFRLAGGQGTRSPEGVPAEPEEQRHVARAERGSGLDLRPERSKNLVSSLSSSKLLIKTDHDHLTLQRLHKPHWADAIGRDPYGLWTEIMVNNVRQKLRWIPPGRFMMGSPEDEDGRYNNEGPQHEVIIETGYWLFETPVTQELWLAVMGENPAAFKGEEAGTLHRPVENVSWDDAQNFITKLNGGRTGLSLSLPSEAQWEYACRAGTTSSRYGEELNDIAWYHGNSDQTTHPVKQKDPNAFGLYDMLGNVWEWCQDDWHGNYAGAPTTGSAWKAEARASKGHAVIRGGSWILDPLYLRSAIRDGGPAGDRVSFLGFRLALGQA